MPAASEAVIEAAFARLQAAMAAHTALVVAKCKAHGVAICSAAADRALAADTEIAAAYERMVAADRAYVTACGEAIT